METPTNIKSIQQIAFLRERLELLRDAVLDNVNPPTLWVGAGLSAKYGQHPTWYNFLRQFWTATCPPTHPDHALVDSLLDAGRFDVAVEMLVRSFRHEFEDAIHKTFAESVNAFPKCLRSWNLHDVITTNYDSLGEACFTAHDIVLPSAAMDTLLSDRPKLVKLHGTAAEPKTCVASVASYVRNYDNLEWYLANIFQTRTVIFLGSSMNEGEPYFRILRLLRENNKMKSTHYCVLAVPDRATAKSEGRRLQEYGIETIPYFPDAKHRFIDELLLYLDRFVQSPRRTDEHLRYVKELISSGYLGLAAVLIQYTCSRPRLRKDSVRHLTESTFDLARAFDKMDPNVSKAERVRVGHSLAAALLEIGTVFVRSPRTLKGLHRAITILQSKDNQLGPFALHKLWKMYAEQKQQWGFDNRNKFDDQIP